MAYHQLTTAERYTLAALRSAGMSNAKIAQRIGRHKSTIGRELTRNRTNWDGYYRTFCAIEKTSARRSRSRRNRRFTAKEMRKVERKLKKKWSPEQISGRFRRGCVMSISHETIYLHVWRDKAKGGELYKCLRQASKQARKRYNSHDSRGRLAGKRHISERPAAVEGRRVFGHWEIDTVVGAGSKDCVATLVERKTGLAFVGKLSDRSQLGMSKRTQMLMRRAPGCFKTITSDNGSEFHDYKTVEKRTGVQYFFATPYHSWERGTSENFNGLLRQYLPKRTSFRHLSQSTCDALAKQLNTRPRKRLGYRTPEEVFYGQ